MSTQTALVFKNSVKKELDSRLRSGLADMHTLRRALVFESFLRRLEKNAQGQFILKGAYALAARTSLGARVTQDLDLLLVGEAAEKVKGAGDQADAVRDLFSVATQRSAGDDPLIFEIPEVKKETCKKQVYQGFRLMVTAKLLGSNYEKFLIDMVVGDSLVGGTDGVPAGTVFASLGYEHRRVPAISLEQHLAEKIHAYTQPREGTNTRTKDLIDLVIIGSLGLDRKRAKEAITAVFSHRATHEVPGNLPAPPKSWEAPYGRMAEAAKFGCEISLECGYDYAKRLYQEIMAA